MYIDNVFEPKELASQVLGILFKKQGHEIKKAIDSRLGTIEKEISKYNDVITGIDSFLEGKKTQLKKMDTLYRERYDKKTELSRPLQRKIDDINKEWEDITFKFNRETDKLIGVEAVEFEKGFDDQEAVSCFSKVDELIEDANTSKRRRSSGTKCSNSSPVPMSGSFRNSIAPGAYAASVVKTSETSDATFQLLNISQEEDKAMARLDSLKRLYSEYQSKVHNLKARIGNLKEEMEQLKLIKSHVVDGEIYNLDLEQLDSLGFKE